MDPEIDRSIQRMRATGRTSPVLIRVSLWLDWGLIAVDHEAKTHRARQEAQDELPHDQLAAMRAMKVEFRSAMVSVTAASHSIDAFYAALNRYVPISRSTRDAWVVNKTRRESQIFETLKHGFELGTDAPSIGADLEWLFGVRGQAVHFQEDEREPVFHPVIPANAAPEDLMFSAESALRAVDLLVQVLDVCTSRPKQGRKFEDLAERVKAMRSFAELVLDARSGEVAE